MKTGRTKCDLCGTAFAVFWRRVWDSNPRAREGKRFSRPPRYDRFDNPPYMNCRVADFIGYSIFLEMRFCDVSEVPEKSVFTRLFCVFATCVLANFQDRLVMTASITLRVIARRGLRSGSASAESAAWFIGEADITLRVFNFCA